MRMQIFNKQSALRDLLSLPRLNWVQAKDVMQRGGYVRRTVWIWECKKEWSVSDEIKGMGAMLVFEAGQSAITVRSFEGVDGEFHCCVVTSSGPNSPIFAYHLTPECEAATDWIEIIDERLR